MIADEPAEQVDDHASTCVISRTFDLEGIPFSWWAIDQSPTLVTVSSQWFGTKSHVTDHDPATTAKRMAAMLLEEHQEKAEQIKAMFGRRTARQPVT